MAISLFQQGLIVQQEFAKLLMLGSGGRIEVAAPLTDDERRDCESHVSGHSLSSSWRRRSVAIVHQLPWNSLLFVIAANAAIACLLSGLAGAGVSSRRFGESTSRQATYSARALKARYCTNPRSLRLSEAHQSSGSFSRIFSRSI